MGRKLCALPLRVRARPRRKSGAERSGTEGDLSNRFVATLLRSRFPQQTRLLPNGSAFGSKKDHHPVPPHTSDSAPPATFTSLSPHHLSQVWHRFLVCSHQSSARGKQNSFSNGHTRPVPAPALLNATHESDWTAPEQRRHSQTDERSRRLRSEHPGLRDHRPEPAYLGLPAVSAALSAPPPPSMRNSRG